MWCAARHCAFESHPLRQLRPLLKLQRSFLLSLVCSDDLRYNGITVRGSIDYETGILQIDRR